MIKRFAKAATTKDRGDRSTVELLGCDIPTFMTYLESKFAPEMTLDNYGEVWNLEYVVSLASNPESSRAGRYERPTMAVKLSRLHYTNIIPRLSRTDVPRLPVVHITQQEAPPAPVVTPTNLTDTEVAEVLAGLGI